MGGTAVTLDALSRVSGNGSTGSFGGIRALVRASVGLPGEGKVTNSTRVEKADEPGC